ncbi:MAG: HAD hydrolase-like protein [Bacteroidales bacterium]
MTPRYHHILFDLDGTLLQSEKGIFRAFRHALSRMELPPAGDSLLRKCIGPSLSECFKQHFGLNDTDTSLAVQYYREYYSIKGKFENHLYPGIREALQQLADGGTHLHLATSKSTALARDILEEKGIHAMFGAIQGSSPDTPLAGKADIIANVLRDRNLNPADCLMVGDREHDILGARAHGMASAGVLYGYGDEQELIGQGADYLVDAPDQLPVLILEDGAPFRTARTNRPSHSTSQMHIS